MAADAMYRQIAEDLRAKIETGTLHGRLPTEIELMEEYSASRNTVRDAIKLLTIRGLVEARAGQGTFVVEKINPFVTMLMVDLDASAGDTPVYIAEVQAGGREPTLTVPRVEIQAVSGVLASALRVAEGTSVVSRHQERFIDGTPWSLQTTHYPMSLVQRGATRLIEASEIEEGTVAYLAAKLGIRQAGYRDTIGVRTANETEAAFFRLPSDGRIQVFEVFRIGFDQEGNRFRLTVTVYPTDRNRFRVDVGTVSSRGEDRAE